MVTFQSTKKIFFSLILCTFYSCSKWSAKQCQEASFKISQGNITHQGRWDKQCQEYKDIITPNICFNALKGLIASGSQQYLKDKYGPLILNCFRKDQLKKFSVE